jgi:hypothetical protein
MRKIITMNFVYIFFMLIFSFINKFILIPGVIFLIIVNLFMLFLSFMKTMEDNYWKILIMTFILGLLTSIVKFDIVIGSILVIIITLIDFIIVGEWGRRSKRNWKNSLFQLLLLLLYFFMVSYYYAFALASRDVGAIKWDDDNRVNNIKHIAESFVNKPEVVKCFNFKKANNFECFYQTSNLSSDEIFKAFTYPALIRNHIKYGKVYYGVNETDYKLCSYLEYPKHEQINANSNSMKLPENFEIDKNKVYMYCYVSDESAWEIKDLKPVISD